MKIQSLAIIFILIIIPISILLSEFLNAQINTIDLQATYDSRLIDATYDAVKAFQLNAFNSSSNDLTAYKMRDIEASANVFLTSIANNFGEGNIGKGGLQSYVPALVYCLYDGYYIYSPYTNNLGSGINNQIVNAENEAFNVLGRKEPTYTYHNGQTLTGLKPYIYYSCRYKKDTTDVVITYSLDNYITIQGTVGNEYWNKSGYILDGVNPEKANFEGMYNGIQIVNSENLKEYIYDPDSDEVKKLPYAKISGTKYYYDSSVSEENKQIFYMQSGSKNYGPSEDDYQYYYDRINSNNSAYKFYVDAFNFTKEVRSSLLNNLTFADAVDVDGNPINANGFNDSTKRIFAKSREFNAEDRNSNFTEHRTAVIRYAIQRNLTIAIANYNNNYATGTAAFAMPNLSETDWYKIINNVSVISFLQGLPIGGKVYNGYSVITNNKNEDFVASESIYITTEDDTYHRVDDEDLIGKSGKMIGYLNNDFERHSDDETNYYYPRRQEACYSSIVNQFGVSGHDKNDDNKNDDLNEYLAWLKSLSGSKGYEILKAYYTALGREKYGMYRYNQLD